MEFYIGILLFITFMIAVALLIYYCQEKRNPKYSFTTNQRAISAIALSIGAPGALPPDFFKSTPYAPTVVSYPVESPPSPPPSRFVSYPQPSGPVLEEDELSDSCSSTSSKIYFTPNTAAYSVAKRMSTTAKIERRTSANPRSAYTSAEAVAAYLLARRMTETANQRSASSLNKKIEKNVSLLKEQKKISQEDAAASFDSEEKYPYIPSTVTAFYLRNKSRSGSPYVPLHNTIDSAPPLENCPPLRHGIHGQSPIRSESLPPQKSDNVFPKSTGLPNRSGSLPPKQTENESMYSERFPFAHSEIEYRSHSPTPLQQLHTVEEELSE